MTENLNEIVEAIENINELIFESLGYEDEYYKLYMTTDGVCQSVRLGDIPIWNSEEDTRAYIDENGVEELKGIEHHLIELINAEFETINKIKI